jgi:hypothetical protein
MSAVSAVSASAPTWDDNTLLAGLRAWCIVVLLMYLGLMSLAAVQSLRLEQPKCGPFTVGQSAVGSCDRLG